MANNTLLASDNFASGSLAAGWSAFPSYSVPQVVVGSPNVIEPIGTNGVNGVLWTGLTWGIDQCSEFTINALTQEAGTDAYLMTRWRASSGNGSGYYGVIFNGQAAIYRDDAGTGTNIAAAVSVTVATGDVWSFQSAGACHSLYQNGNRVLFCSDATYASGGAPGVLLQAVSPSHLQVSAWRGYNSVQQDGIWQKQGVVFAPLSADLSSNGYGVYEGCCLYDTNPQLLTQYAKVYKLWFSFGPLATASVGYAESPDLINWTRQSGSVIASVQTPGVIKNGDTYYLYCQASASAGSGATELYTSTDGVTWVQQSSSVFATGAFPLKPVAIVNGTWYALYGKLGAPGSFSKVYLVTSPDGQNWTAYGSNPVISAQSTYPYICVTEANGIFYVWMQVGPSAAQNAGTAPRFDPTESARFSTTDFEHWSGPVHSLHHSQMFEAVNTPVNNTEPVGGTAPTAIFNINGKAYMLYEVSQGDSTGPVVAQYALAIAPAPISGVVQYNEDANSQQATDAFTSGAGNLDGNWTTPTGGTALQIVSGPYVEPTATSTVCQAVYTGASFGQNQYSAVTLETLSGTLFQSYISPMVLASITALTDYEAEIGSPSATEDAAVKIYKRVNGTPIQLGPTMGATPNVGDVWLLSVIFGGDGFPVLSLFQNGSLIIQVQDTSSTPITTGNPGMAAYSSVAIADAQISLFAAGNANSMPSYPSSGQIPDIFGPATRFGSDTAIRVSSPKTRIMGTNLGTGLR